MPVSTAGHRAHHDAVDAEGSIRLLSSILWELPSLPLAAVALCRRCPELAVCEQLPPPRGWHSVGVRAGRVLVTLPA